MVKDYDLPPSVPVFMFVGRIIKYKGIPLIFESLAKLAAKGQDFRMVLIGSVRMRRTEESCQRIWISGW